MHNFYFHEVMYFVTSLKSVSALISQKWKFTLRNILFYTFKTPKLMCVQNMLFAEYFSVISATMLGGFWGYVSAYVTSCMFLSLASPRPGLSCVNERWSYSCFNRSIMIWLISKFAVFLFLKRKYQINELCLLLFYRV